MMDFPVFDAHVDLSYFMGGSFPETDFSALSEGHVTSAGLGKGKVRLFVNAFYIPDAQNGPHTAAVFLQELLEQSRRHFDALTPVCDALGLRSLFEDTSTPPGYLLMIENADALLETPLDVLQALGIRVIGLTHLGKNRICDGNGVSDPQGFSTQGRQLLSDLDEAGFAVDLAHLSRPGLDQIADAFHGPLCSTHTGFAELLDLPRNLRDRDIRLILDRRGVVGMTFAPEMLTADAVANMDTLVRHIDHFVQRYGVGGLGLGSDFCGFSGVLHGLEDASRFPDLAERLLQRGYSEDDVRAIFAENWLRFYTRLLP
jgi:membrane dipeptidase